MPRLPRWKETRRSPASVRRRAIFLDASATALGKASKPPPLDAFDAALAAYNTEVDASRHEGLTLALSSIEVEPVFALGFALEQLRHNFADLQRCA